VATLSLRVPDEVLARFDTWAGGHGGRAPVLRRLISDAAATPPPTSERLPVRPLKLTVRLPSEDGRGLAREARAMGLTRTPGPPRSSATA